MINAYYVDVLISCDAYIADGLVMLGVQFVKKCQNG
jgi:hypothetical protein